MDVNCPSPGPLGRANPAGGSAHRESRFALPNIHPPPAPASGLCPQSTCGPARSYSRKDNDTATSQRPPLPPVAQPPKSALLYPGPRKPAHRPAKKEKFRSARKYWALESERVASQTLLWLISRHSGKSLFYALSQPSLPTMSQKLQLLSNLEK